MAGQVLNRRLSQDGAPAQTATLVSAAKASSSLAWLGRASCRTTSPSRRKTKLGQRRTWNERQSVREALEQLLDLEGERPAVPAPGGPELEQDKPLARVDLGARRRVALVPVLGLGRHV
jgi:hypothetical protein